MRALVLPAGVLVLALMVVPLLVLARYSLNVYSPTELMVAALTGRNYVAAVADPYYRAVMGTTLWVSALCTAVALVAGFPAGYALARLRGRAKSMLVLLTVFPLMVGNVVRAAGWMVLLGNSGVVNAALAALGVTSGPVQLIYTLARWWRGSSPWCCPT